MSGFDSLKNGFCAPADEFSAFPFWFLNDKLEETELIRQLDDFNAKGICGIVLHPRLGLSAETPYLSGKYMYYIKVCVRRASELNMKVVLYDEGMYPSGSAGGLVAAENPRWRSRGVYSVKRTKKWRVPKDETLIGYYLLKFSNGQLTDAIRAEENETQDGYEPYAFLCGYTKGCIRGVHPGTDDTDSGAPPSGDLLGSDAVNAFIRLTHERYYTALSGYFGTTVIGFFTDEPDVTGRRSKMPSYAVWTENFYPDYREACSGEELLPWLLFEGTHTERARSCHKHAVYQRLSENYYGKLQKWCLDHNIFLCGHPAESGDIGLERKFSVPGQDIVWRMIDPENNLSSPDSIAAKCASDSAKNLSRRRCSMEVFGVCGQKGNPWDFTFGDMLWHLNHMFVRGINMIFPHAFYYSTRTSLQFSDRPPDVGPHNIWWEEYAPLAGYMARLSFLNTDSKNCPLCAVLCSEDMLPYTIAKPLFENQIPFNYVTPDLLSEGVLKAGGYRYTVLLVGDMEISPELQFELHVFEGAGGAVFYANGKSEQEILSFVLKHVEREFYFETISGDPCALRIEKIQKYGCSVYLLCNESAPDSKNTVDGILHICEKGRVYRADPFRGTFLSLFSERENGGTKIPIKIRPCRITVLAVNEDEAPDGVRFGPGEVCDIGFTDYTAGEITINDGGFFEILYTGTLMINEIDTRLVLRLPEVRDKAKIYINGAHTDTLLLPPWKTDITDFVYSGENLIEVRVTGSAANRFGTAVPMGLLPK